MRRKLFGIILCFWMVCLMAGCSGAPGPSSDNAAPDQISESQTPMTDGAAPRTKAEVLPARMDQAASVFIDGGYIDLSQTEKGFIGVSFQSDVRMKFQVIHEEETYTYDLPSDGTETIYPLNMGDGTYVFKLMQNVGGTKYMKIWTDTAEVRLMDEFQPFLRPNQICSYDASDPLVEKAYELTRYAKSDLEIAGAIYDFLKENVVYDHEKARTVQSGYLPDPSSTLITKDGICFDYSSLAAAMLRSQGVPCQVVTGYVGEDQLYHAWNRIYIKEQGWLSVEIKVSPLNWKRVDITFAAGGSSADVLEDDARYTNRFIY